jgi:hypothetical protein
MPLFTVKTSRKIEIIAKIEESTAKMLDRYAHYHKGSAEDVVNESLEYIFKHDKEFQQHLTTNPSEDVPSTVRTKKAPGSSKGPKVDALTSSAASATAK